VALILPSHSEEFQNAGVIFSAGMTLSRSFDAYASKLRHVAYSEPLTQTRHWQQSAGIALATGTQSKNLRDGGRDKAKLVDGQAVESLATRQVVARNGLPRL
jgi:hypothetical protein